MGEEPVDADSPTQLAGLSEGETQSVRAWGLSEHEDDAPTVRFGPGRITAVAVAASLAAVTLTGVLAWQHMRGEDSPATTKPVPVADRPSPAPETPPAWQLNGTYRVDIRNPEGTKRDGHDGTVTTMSDLGVPTATVWIAYKTECTPIECKARSVSLDDVTHRNENGAEVLFRWNGIEWESAGGDGPNGGRTQPVQCMSRPGSSFTVETWGTMSPLPDGSFRGTFHRTTVATECAGAQLGDQQDVPMAVVRIGDVPPGIFGG